MKNPAKTFEVSIVVNPELAKKMNFTPTSFKTRRPKDGIKQIINGLEDGNLGVLGSLREPTQRELGKSDHARIAVINFVEQLMLGKDFTTETRRHGGIPEWVRGGAATWPGTAVSTAGGDLGPLTFLPFTLDLWVPPSTD